MLETMFKDEIINKALFFAIDAHKNQKIKYPENMPYSTHIVGVLLTAINYVKGSDLDLTFLAQVALLHDTLEDTSVIYGDILKTFGKEVADGVLALTKNEKLSKETQMIDCIKRIKLQPKEVAIVKLADRYFNTRCRVPIWSTEKQNHYIEEAQLICDELGYASLELKNKLQLNIKTLKNN